MMEDIAKIKNDEWLETDGLGGFASGTVSGIRTRHYHARLLTTADPHRAALFSSMYLVLGRKLKARAIF